MFILGTVVYHVDLFSHRKQREGIVETVMKPQQEAKATPSATALISMDELKKMGFARCLIPESNVKRMSVIKGIEITGVKTVAECVETLF